MHYNIVELAHRMDENLFKDSIPENAYEVLFKLFSGYTKWVEDQQAKKAIRSAESEKMYQVLEFMRNEYGKGNFEFTISFSGKNRLVVRTLGDDKNLIINLK